MIPNGTRSALRLGKAHFHGKLSPLRPIGLLDFMVWTIVIEQILRPWRELFVSLVKVTTIVAERPRPTWSVSNGPDCSSPYPAVCTPPGLSLPIVCVSKVPKESVGPVHTLPAIRRPVHRIQIRHRACRVQPGLDS